MIEQLRFCRTVIRGDAYGVELCILTAPTMDAFVVPPFALKRLELLD